MKDSSKPKVILDIAPLGYAQDHKSGARGIHRVCQHLFDGLLKSNRYDPRFVSTSHLAGAYEMLETHGLPPEKALSFSRAQLKLSRLGRRASRWVHGHLSQPGLSARGQRAAMSTLAKYACHGEKWIHPRFLKGADIYHSPLAPISSLVGNNPKIKSFLTIHDLLPLTQSENPGRQLRPYLQRLLDSISKNSFVFCISDCVKADLLNLTDFQPERVFITPLAADETIFFPVIDFEKISTIQTKYGIPKAPYFLTLSSFDPRKNFGHIIRCFSQLVRSGEAKDSCLVIAGSNPERNRFVEEAVSQDPEIQPRIIMPGFIPDEDLSALYSGALAFLFPSLGEGFGIPVLEAMQCGTPVISSSSTSLPEVIGDAGILLDPTDTESWCGAMTAISNNAQLREDLRRKGLVRSTFFSWAKFIEATENGYSFALENE